MRQLRFQSDGSGADTVITDEKGEIVKGVTSATIYLEGSREPVTASIELLGPKLDVHADVKETNMTCPLCQHTQSHYCNTQF